MNKSALHRAAVWYFSASQLKNADSCLRLWAWEQICGIREPSAAAAALGTDVHTVLERWLLNGVPPNPFERVGEIANAGLHLLPIPGPELEIEREFKIKIGNHHYRGKVDVGFVDQAGVPWVIDHKTTSDFGWMLTPDLLIDDVQALLYAKDALDRYGVDQVHLRWVYYLTRKPHAAKVSEIRITRTEVDERWPVIDELVTQLNQIHRTVTDPLTLTPNAKSCAKYGGCPHIQRCNLTPEERITSIMTQVDLRARIQGRVASRSPNQTPAAVATTEVPANRAHQEQVTLNPQMSATQTVQTAPTSPPVQTQMVPSVQAAYPPVHMVPAPEPQAPIPANYVPQPQQINPPEQPTRAVQLSNVVEYDAAGPRTRANEQEASASAKEIKTRVKKTDTGFVIKDRRTALVLVHAAAASSGDPALVNTALQAVLAMYQEPGR